MQESTAPPVIDYYQLMGVPRHASEEELLIAYGFAYGRLVSAGESTDDPESKLMQLIYGWKVLSQPESRRDYDQKLREWDLLPANFKRLHSLYAKVTIILDWAHTAFSHTSDHYVRVRHIKRALQAILSDEMLDVIISQGTVADKRILLTNVIRLLQRGPSSAHRRYRSSLERLAGHDPEMLKAVKRLYGTQAIKYLIRFLVVGVIGSVALLLIAEIRFSGGTAHQPEPYVPPKPDDIRPRDHITVNPERDRRYMNRLESRGFVQYAQASGPVPACLDCAQDSVKDGNTLVLLVKEGSDAIFTLTTRGEGKCVRMVFVKGGEEYAIHGIPDGVYDGHVKFGRKLYLGAIGDNCGLFFGSNPLEEHKESILLKAVKVDGKRQPVHVSLLLEVITTRGFIYPF